MFLLQVEYTEPRRWMQKKPWFLRVLVSLGKLVLPVPEIIGSSILHVLFSQKVNTYRMELSQSWGASSHSPAGETTARGTLTADSPSEEGGFLTQGYTLFHKTACIKCPDHLTSVWETPAGPSQIQMCQTKPLLQLYHSCNSPRARTCLPHSLERNS